MLPISTYAAESTSVPQSDKYYFLYENGFILGEVIDYDETEDSLSIDVYYPSIDIYANISYKELNNGDISVKNTEGVKCNI